MASSHHVLLAVDEDEHSKEVLGLLEAQKVVSTWKYVAVFGAGFFNDAYDLFVLNIVNVVFSSLYPNDYTAKVRFIVSSSIFVGAIIGQIMCGVLSDRLSRKKSMLMSSILLIVGSILRAVAPSVNPASMFFMIAASMFILGVGIGGEYPNSATRMAESSTDSNRGKMMGLLFSLQGVGMLCAALFALILISVLPNSNFGLEIVWRLLFGIGALPTLFAFYWRWHAEDDHTEDMSLDAVAFSTKLRVCIRLYGRRLLGTAGTWFIFDVVFYAQVQYKPIAQWWRNLELSANTLSLTISLGNSRCPLCFDRASFPPPF
jgi:PHS family inorganic phosphate transporter-like MFS transporter